ncbi:MAG: carboxy-S-adenosyl-L-methionine synthase CmoA, partial [Marinobacter alexandrii]
MSKPGQPPKQETDRLFATERRPEDFRFDASVARVFPDMIRRSVPGYTTIIPMIEVITE